MAELLFELVLPRHKAERLAPKLLRQFGSLGKLLRATATEINHHDEVDAELVYLLRLIDAVLIKATTPRRDRRLRLNTRARIKAYLGRRLPVPKDRIRILYLDRSDRLIADLVLSNLYEREIIGEGFRLNAHHLVLIGRDNGIFRTVGDIAGFMDMTVIDAIREGPRPRRELILARQLNEDAAQRALQRQAGKLRTYNGQE